MCVHVRVSMALAVGLGAALGVLFYRFNASLVGRVTLRVNWYSAVAVYEVQANTDKQLTWLNDSDDIHLDEMIYHPSDTSKIEGYKWVRRLVDAAWNGDTEYDGCTISKKIFDLGCYTAPIVNVSVSDP